MDGVDWASGVDMPFLVLVFVVEIDAVLLCNHLIVCINPELS
jgi:hypothetical protein